MDSANMFLNIKSFEVMSMQISVLSQTLNIIIIYRPPNNASIELFMEEFTSLLEFYATRHGLLIVAGYFNIHVDNKSDLTTRKFLNLVDSFKLQQHVQKPTHSAGHTLDLFLSRYDENVVQSTDEHDPSISDHCTVTCDCAISAINTDSLVNDIRLSPIITDNPVDISVKINQ